MKTRKPSEIFKNCPALPSQRYLPIGLKKEFGIEIPNQNKNPCRHKWEQIYCDCPNCNKGEHIVCEKCGKEKDKI